MTIKASTDDEDERAGCPRGQLDASPVPAEDSSVFIFVVTPKRQSKDTFPLWVCVVNEGDYLIDAGNRLPAYHYLVL